MSFPTISKPHLTLSETWEDPSMKSEMEGGYDISRPRHYRVRGEWKLRWNAMTNADWATLLTYYKTTAIGGSVAFSWTSPNDNTARTVRFDGKPTATPVSDDYIAVEVALKEV